jgi:DNA polymerase
VIAGRELYLFPIFHPAAALYTPTMMATLKEDVARLPELLAHARGGSPSPAPQPPQPAGDAAATRPQAGDQAVSVAAPASPPPAAPAQAEQLGLF